MISPTFRFHGAIYRWLPTADGLKLERSGRVVAEVVPEERHPSMFRIKLLGKPVSDMVNLSRAKNAELRLADHALQNRPRWAVEPHPAFGYGSRHQPQPPLPGAPAPLPSAKSVTGDE
jgi:hypothetical protein